MTSSGAAASIDFGFRRHGGALKTLPQSRVLRLRATAPTSARARERGPSLARCQQCGICTTSCAVSQGRFPRHQAALAQLGARELLRRDPNLWECQGCGDCSRACPSQLHPAGLLACARREAIAEVTPLGSFDPSARRLAGMSAAALAAVMGLVAVGGSFTPEPAVRYASLLPQRIVIVAYGAISAVVAAAVAVGCVRLTRCATPAVAPEGRLRTLSAICRVLGDAFAHRQQRACSEHHAPALAHAAALFGVLGLLLLAGAAALAVATGAEYPFPLGSPQKLLGNAASGALIGGALYALARRGAAALRGQPSTLGEWLWPSLLLGAGVSGGALQFLRLANLALAAYPAYIAHLAIVLLLFASLPWSDASHGAFRVAALTGARRANPRQGRAREMTPSAPRGAETTGVPERTQAPEPRRRPEAAA